MVAVKSLTDAAAFRSVNVATAPVNGAPSLVLTVGWPVDTATGSAKAKSSVTTRLWPLTGSSGCRPGWKFTPSKLNSTSVPSVSVTRVTIGLLNNSPRNSAVPEEEDGTKNFPRLVLPLKYSMLVELGRRTLRKIATKPRVAASTGVDVGELARAKLRSIELSLNMANV